jgi:hypothetical protein
MLKVRPPNLLQYTYRRMFFPIGQLFGDFDVPIHLTASLLQVLKGVYSV